MRVGRALLPIVVTVMAVGVACGSGTEVVTNGGGTAETFEPLRVNPFGESGEPVPAAPPGGSIAVMPAERLGITEGDDEVPDLMGSADDAGAGEERPPAPAPPLPPGSATADRQDDPVSSTSTTGTTIPTPTTTGSPPTTAPNPPTTDTPSDQETTTTTEVETTTTTGTQAPPEPATTTTAAGPLIFCTRSLPPQCSPITP